MPRAFLVERTVAAVPSSVKDNEAEFNDSDDEESRDPVDAAWERCGDGMRQIVTSDRQQRHVAMETGVIDYRSAAATVMHRQLGQLHRSQLHAV